MPVPDRDSAGSAGLVVVCLRYRPGEDDPTAPQRQDTYLRALATLPEVSIHLGHFLTSQTRMRLVQPLPDGAQTVEVLRTEEKGSDVNLATYLLADAFRGDCEVALGTLSKPVTW